MISKQSITRFLRQERDSYTWLKREPGHVLDAALNELTPVPDFGQTKLWLHQKVCFLLLEEIKRFMLFLDLGAGKTLISLQLIRYHKQRGEKPRAVVFVPYITSVATWVDEVAKHAPDLKCVPLLGSSKQNLSSLEQDADLFVICYQSAVSMVTTKNGKKWKLNPSDVRKYFKCFDTLILDEVHKCQSASSLVYRMCRAISAQCEYVLGLTGTPFGRDLEDLWPQFYLIDFGETLGPTLGFYKEVFFSKKQNYWGGYEFTFKKRLMPDLKRIIRHKSIRYRIDEFHDMPPKKYIVEKIPMPEQGVGYIEKAMETIRREAVIRKDYQIIKSNYLILRQLSSGFMTLRGEDTTRLQIKFDDNPKLDTLMGLIEGMPAGHKMVVFHEFIYTNQMISERLKAAKIGHARIWSGQRDKLGELKRFRDDPDCTIMVLNSRSGSSSLNLQFASYIVFFEQPVSSIDRTQAEGRCWRPGQARRVFIYDLLVTGTLDAHMKRANRNGQEQLEYILNNA